jgi:hypothetical protein
LIGKLAASWGGSVMQCYEDNKAGDTQTLDQHPETQLYDLEQMAQQPKDLASMR